MQSLFETYFQLGFHHILDKEAYDHALFLVALCAIYQFREWKKVAILATAFTIGHSLTLAMAAFDIFQFNQDLVELLIPITILLTVVLNVITPQGDIALSHQKLFDSPFRGLEGNLSNHKIHYTLALIFGFIHGMGFSNFFKATTIPGRESNLLEKLLSFNLGVEVGQIIIVFILLVISLLGMNYLKIKPKEWMLFVSGMAAGGAVLLML